MGCWNTTCGISGLPIHCGEDVVVFLLTRRRFGFMENFVHSNTYFEPCLMPFYGRYNDYGAVEDCYGPGLPVLIAALREKLFEMDWGENECHDIPAKREELDIEKLFELDHEDRLYIEYRGMRYKQGENHELIEEEEPIKALKVVHVQVKKSIFDYILSNYKSEEYIGKEFKRKLITFSDIQKDLDKTLDRLKNNPFLSDLGLRGTGLASNYLHEDLNHPLLSIDNVFKMDNSNELLKEMLKGGLMDRFMDETRKAWIKPIGNGSQNAETEPYKILMNAMTLAIQKDDTGDYDDE